MFYSSERFLALPTLCILAIDCSGESTIHRHRPLASSRWVLLPFTGILQPTSPKLNGVRMLQKQQNNKKPLIPITHQEIGNCPDYRVRKWAEETQSSHPSMLNSKMDAQQINLGTVQNSPANHIIHPTKKRNNRQEIIIE